MGVLTESLISPGGIVKGLPKKSPLYEDYMRTPCGLHVDSMWSPCELHVNSKESGRTQGYTRTGPHGVHMDSWWTPSGVQVNSCKTPWKLLGLQGYMWLSVMTSLWASNSHLSSLSRVILQLNTLTALVCLLLDTILELCIHLTKFQII